MKRLYFKIVLISVILSGIFYFGNHAFAATELVTNGGAESGDMTGWSNIVNGGSGWAVGGDPHTGDHSFYTSYSWCTMDQTIDLVAAGYSEAELDAAPDIDFATWIMQRYDHNGEYYLIYELQDESYNPIVTENVGTVGSPIELVAGVPYFEESHTFSSYGSGVRYVYVKIAGQDGSPDWGGYYGPYFDDISVTIPDTTSPSILTLSPANDSTGTALDSNLVMMFDENVDVETGNITIKKTSDNTTIETIDVTSGQVTGTGTDTITIVPSADFSELVGYYILIDSTTFDDAAGNSFAGISDSSTWNFTTTGTAGATLSESTLALTEGGSSGTYTVILDTEPANDVNIAITDVNSELTIYPSTLTFTNSDWETAQTVTVLATDDEDVEGIHADTITHTATSSDSNYNDLSIGDVAVTITDNNNPDGKDITSRTEISRIENSEKGTGTIELYDTDEELHCTINAWDEGGAIGNFYRVQRRDYLSVIKNKTGTTIHIYDLNCNLIDKQKLSFKLHPRRMTIRNFAGKANSQEIGISARRGSTTYVKLLRYNKTENQWYVLGIKLFKPVPKGYSISHNKNKNILIKKNNKILFRWRIYKKNLSKIKI